MFPATSAANVEDPRNARHENKRFRKILRLQRGLQLAVCIMVYVKKSDPFENACTWRPSYEINNVEMFFVLQTTTADRATSDGSLIVCFGSIRGPDGHTRPG